MKLHNEINKRIKKIFITSIFITITLCVSSQQIENIRFEQDGKKINIYYDITGAKSGQKFDIKIYCSEDGGYSWGSPLKSVTGATGKNQTPSHGKKVTWDVLADRDKLVGDIKFHIKATIAVNFEGGTFTDSRDRKTYKWVRLGTQIWMAENLNYYTSSGSWCYDGKSSDCAKYGRLYNWVIACNICPNGWHLPTDTEWTNLVNYLGGSAGGKLKETGTTHWNLPNTGATNESGFTALPAGYRYYRGSVYNVGNNADYWSATELNSSSAWYRRLTYDRSEVRRGYDYKTNGFSVRCIKDPVK